MKKKMSKNTNLGTIHQIGVMHCNSFQKVLFWKETRWKESQQNDLLSKNGWKDHNE
jgi:hypothetical protein